MTWDEHFENRAKLPEEEVRRYYGKQVAWSIDGKQILAAGENEADVFQAVKAAGYGSDQFILSYVPFPDEVIWGGNIVCDGEEGA